MNSYCTLADRGNQAQERSNARRLAQNDQGTEGQGGPIGLALFQ